VRGERAPVPRGRLRTGTPAPAWYDAAWAQLAVLLALLTAFVAYPVTGVVRRMPHHSRGRSPGSARWLAVLGPVTVAGTLLYLLFMLANAAKVTGPVVLGRPVPWLVLQLLAAGTVAATATAAVHWWRGGHATGWIRLGLLTAGGLLFIPWAVHWGLLVP
jgi:hypothetical protein